ncbi:MAG: histidinol-phosphate transaminase [Armatimonas sp.]
MSTPRLCVSERVERLVPYQPGKPIETVQRELGLSGPIIKLASNENPLGPSPKALLALQEALTQLALYPDGGSFALREAVSTALGVSGDQLLFGNGSDEVIHMLGLTFLEPCDEIVVGEPTFSLYESAATLAGATTVKVPLTSGDLKHDAAAMASAYTDKTRLVFIANPHNPTGSWVDRAAIDILLATLPPRAFLVLDEAYIEYVEDAEFPRAVDYLKQGAPIIGLRTFSKLYGLAGLRVGYAVASPDVVHLMNQTRSPFNVNLAAQKAAVAALGDLEFVELTRRTNEAGMHQLTAGAEALGCSVVPSKANFLLIETGRPCQAMFQALLKRGVIVRAFGSLPTMLRVTVGTESQNSIFLAALKEAMDEVSV